MNENIESFFNENSEVKISENDRLEFAKQSLFFLWLTCAGVVACYIMLPDNEAVKAVFELVKIGALPLITLVFTFYFPNKN